MKINVNLSCIENLTTKNFTLQTTTDSLMTIHAIVFNNFRNNFYLY